MAFFSSLLTSFMSNPMSFVVGLLAIVFVLGLVIFFHEFGHFIVAKKSGVRVEEFAFGFGPKIVSFVYGETRYSLNWIPLGGYNKFQGEVTDDYEGPVLEGAAESKPEARDVSRDFLAQPWYSRILIALAGPAMNYVLAIVVFMGIFLYWGMPVQTIIGEVVTGMPAEAAGFKIGDRIRAVEGTPMMNFIDIASTIHGRPGLETTIEISRGDQYLQIKVIPENKNGTGLIGIRPTENASYEPIGVIDAFRKSVWQCWYISYGTLVYLYHAAVEHVKPEVSGPIGIVQVIAKTAQQKMEDVLSLMAMISVAIGLFNLFPIPLLDGGHVVYYLIEGIRRKPLSAKIIGRVNQVGFAIIMGIFVFATFSDIQRIWRKPKAPVAAPTATPEAK